VNSLAVHSSGKMNSVGRPPGFLCDVQQKFVAAVLVGVGALLVLG